MIANSNKSRLKVGLKNCRKAARIFTFLGSCAGLVLLFVVGAKIDVLHSVVMELTVYFLTSLFVLMFVIVFIFILLVEYELSSRKRRGIPTSFSLSRTLGGVLRIIYAICIAGIFIYLTLCSIIKGIESASFIILWLPLFYPLAVIIVILPLPSIDESSENNKTTS